MHGTYTETATATLFRNSLIHIQQPLRKCATRFKIILTKCK